jgi:microcystin-dependent protein
MSAPYVGEIRMFGGSFPPNGWAFCDGATMAISQNDTLFNLIGTTYGGDGQTTFNLPDLRGRVPVHQGTFLGNTFVIGQPGGVESVVLTTQQMASHNHTLMAAGTVPSLSPLNAVPAIAVSTQAGIAAYGTGSSPTTLAPTTIQNDGGNLAHENRQPFLGINFIISLFGVFPPRS